MTEQDRASRAHRRSERSTSVIAQIYASSAVVAFVSTFLPLWSAPGRVERFDTMNLWSAVATPNMGGSIAAMGVAMMLALVGLLLLAAWFGGRRIGPAAAASGIAALAILLLVAKPASSAPKPDLGAGGALMMGLAIVVIATTVWQAIVLGARKTP